MDSTNNIDLASANQAMVAKKTREESFRYFLFSKEQLDLRTQIEKSVGKRYVPGRVIIKGKPKLFTEISKKSTNRFQDARIVAKGYTVDFKYTEPYVE